MPVTMLVISIEEWEQRENLLNELTERVSHLEAKDEAFISVPKLAKQLDVDPTTLYRWRDSIAAGKSSNPLDFVQQGSSWYVTSLSVEEYKKWCRLSKREKDLRLKPNPRLEEPRNLRATA